MFDLISYDLCYKVLCYCYEGVRLCLYGIEAADGLTVNSPGDMNDWSSGEMILTGENRRTRRKTCPSTTLFTTNPT
jgi:hypothetical protein